MNTIRLAAPLQYESTVDGPGFRIVLWTQGCRMKCPGCHNPETHNECGGSVYNVEDIINDLKTHHKHHKGLTLSGGDPFLQPEQCLIIAKAAHELELNVWAYCGMTFEQLAQDPGKFALLQECDVLVDGPFVLALRDTTLAFRGSSNQRLVDVQKSLIEGSVVEYGK